MANLISNWSFETDTTGWTAINAGDTITRANTYTAKHGSWHGVFTVGASTAGRNLDYAQFTVQPNTVYSLGAWVRWHNSGSAGVQRNLRIDTRWVNASSVITTVTGSNRAISATDWDQLTTLNVTSLSDSVGLIVRIAMINTPVAGDAYAVDAVQCNEGATLEALPSGAPKWTFSTVARFG